MILNGTVRLRIVGKVIEVYRGFVFESFKHNKMIWIVSAQIESARNLNYP